MGDVRSSVDQDDDLSDEEAPPESSRPLCRASYFPIIRMCSRRSNQVSARTSSSTARQDSDDVSMISADETPIERRAVRDRNGRILFYYAPLPRRLPCEVVGCRVSLCKSRSAGEILSTSSTSRSAVNSARFAVPLQVRRRQLDDIRRRLAAVDDDDDDDGDSWSQHNAESGTCRDDRVNCNRTLADCDTDRHRQQRRQRLEQAVSVLPSCTDVHRSVRRGGSVESDCTSRSDRDGSTDDSASALTDTDHDQASAETTSDINWRCGKSLCQNGVVVINDMFQVKHYVLQEEARLALQQAQRMAHMQMEFEKHPKKKSPIAEIVGIPHFGDTSKCRLTSKHLTTMSVGELQLIVNDLLSQIEGLNADLVQLLLDRDEFYMQQDSFLVDIDDLTRRGLETVSCYDLRSTINER